MSIARIILVIVKQQLQLEDRLLTAVDNEIAKFQDICPPREVVLRTLEIKNNINSGLENIQNALKNTRTTTDTANAVIVGSEILITIATALPLPNQVTTVGITNTFATRLVDLKDAIKTGRALVSSLNEIILTLEGIVASVQGKLNILDQLLLRCTQEAGIPFEVTNNVINNSTETSTQGLFNGVVTYKDLRLEVAFDEQDFSTLKRRFGKATDRRGVVRFRTNPTFATDNNIIIEELKFLIDNQV